MVNVNGVIIASTQDLNAAVTYLANNLNSNPALNTLFRADPIQYFYSIGISHDLAREVMIDLGLRQEAANIDCTGTCAVTQCSFTCLFTITLAVELSAKSNTTS